MTGGWWPRSLTDRGSRVPQVNPALCHGICPRSPGKSWVLATHFPLLQPSLHSEPALAHAPLCFPGGFSVQPGDEVPAEPGGSRSPEPMEDPPNSGIPQPHVDFHPRHSPWQGSICPRHHGAALPWTSPHHTDNCIPLPDELPFPRPHVGILPSKCSFSELATTSEVPSLAVKAAGTGVGEGLPAAAAAPSPPVCR